MADTKRKKTLKQMLFRGTVVKGGVVPKTEMWGYATGICGQNMSYNIISNWLFYFCTDVLFIGPLLVGIITGVSRIFDAFNDPIAGVIMDRKRFKNGEKLRPYVLATPLFVGLFAALMFVDFGIKSDMGKFAYMMIIYLLWDVLYSFQDIAQWGMTAIISPIPKERAAVSQWARIGGSVGGWLPGLIPLIIGSAYITGLIQEKYLFLIFGIVFGFGGMILSLFNGKAKERVRSNKPQASVWKSFGLLFKNKTVMLLLLANILNAFSLTVPAIYFFKYKVDVVIFGYEVSGITFSFIYGLLVGIPGALGMLFTTNLAKKIGGMKNVLLIATLMNISMRVLAFIIGFEGINIVFVMLLMSLASIPNSMTGIASTAIWGDSIDIMEVKTGHRAEAVTFASQNLIAKASSGIGLLMSGITLTILRFDAKLYDAGLPQSETFDKLIWPVYILGPAIGSILYLLPLIFVRYSRSMMEQVAKELALKREAAGSSVHLDDEIAEYLDYDDVDEFLEDEYDEIEEEEEDE